MCGIAGFCSLEADYSSNKSANIYILVKMRKRLSHRGMDGNGEYLCQNCGLSHARLTIRDLKKGSQPMEKNISNRKYVIVYNGEIYNTHELKKNLEQKGYEFETTSDTEIVLTLFIEYGEKSVNMLNGIFAYAIWDEAKKRLFLFRDRCGIKPLFYTIKNNTIVFASEPKAVFAHPHIIPEADNTTLCEVLGIGPARTEGCGVFKNLKEIKYGSYGIFDCSGFKEVAYWKLKSRRHTDNYDQTVDNVRLLLKSAVEMQMVSDVPVCSFLSGGIDSCIVTALASNYINKQGKQLNTFSFDFVNNDKNFKANSFQPEQDRPYVDIMLKNFSLNHKYLECSDEDLYDFLFESVDAKDLPGMADVDASLLYFCGLVKKYNKVTLTGECADEIFGGYPWFHKKEFLEADTFPWSVNLDYRLSFLKKGLADNLKIKEYVNERYKASVNEVEFAGDENTTEKSRKIISYLNLKWFMTTLLDRMDRSSMYSGLEARVPFADHRIIEYMWNVPWEYKCHNGVVKGLLRDSAKDLLPPVILSRKKSPYPKTYSPGYEKVLSQNLTAVINDSSSPINSLFDKSAVESLINSKKQYGKPWFGQLMGSVQMMAYILQINYWLKKYDLQP